MSDTKTALLRSLLHTLEVGVTISVGLFVLYLFREDADIMQAIKDLLLAILGGVGALIPVFFAKFARESKKVNIPDYVNGESN